MRASTIICLSAAALTFVAQPVHAEDCKTLRAQHDEAQVWECRTAFNSGTQGSSRDACFLSAAEGFAWIGRQTGHATGRIEVGNCRNQGKTMTYRQFLATQ